MEAVAHKRVVAPRLYGDYNSQAAVSKPLLTSVFSHRICMNIAIPTRLRRSRCLQACCRTASVKRLQFSGGCVEAVASSGLLHRVSFRFSGGCVGAVTYKRLVAPRLHGDCVSQAAAPRPLVASVFVAPRLHNDIDSQVAVSKPLLTSVFSHRVCMGISILRRLRRSCF